LDHRRGALADLDERWSNGIFIDREAILNLVIGLR
jgi:hypothetical protein